MAARKIRLTHPGKILREEFMVPVALVHMQWPRPWTFRCLV